MNALSLRAALEGRLRHDWSWPSPESGFARWIFICSNQQDSWISSWTHESLLHELDSQARLDYSPLLASCGFVAQEVEIPDSLLEKWQVGFERLQQREPFPHDRQAFPFHPLELLGLSLAARRFADEEGKQWLAHIVERSQTVAAPFDFWSWSLMQLAALVSGVKQANTQIGNLWSVTDENSALLLWLQNAASNCIGMEVDISVELLEQAESHLQKSLFSPLPQLQLTADIEKNALYLWVFDSLNQPPIIASATASSSPSMISYQMDDLRDQIDFAIITVREDEFKAVLQRLPKGFRYQGQKSTYFIHRVPLHDDQIYTVATVRCPEQGGAAGQRVASDVIADMNPHWIMLVGIAGAVPANEFTLGDVVVAMRLQDFSVQARLEEGVTEYAMGGGPMRREVQDHIALLPAMGEELDGWNTPDALKFPQPDVSMDATNFYGEVSWQSKVRESLERHFGKNLQDRLPCVVTGAVAASDVLMKDTTLFNQWKQSARQLLAVEMELSGVYTAAQTRERDYPIAAVRGISDIVGFKRHPDWTEYACQTAASFAYALIKTRPFEPVIKTSNTLLGIL